MPITPRVLLGPPAGMELAMACGRISGGGGTVAEVVGMLRARLMPGCAVAYDVDCFSVVLLGADMEADDGEAVAEALAGCERQRVPHRVMRSAPAGGADADEVHTLILAGGPDVLAFAVREFQQVHRGRRWR